MENERRTARLARAWHATAAALLLCAAAGIAVDLFFYVAASDDTPARARSGIALVGAPVLSAQVRVRPSSSHRLGQPALLHASLHAAAATPSEHGLPSPAAPITNRQRLAELTILRI